MTGTRREGGRGPGVSARRSERFPAEECFRHLQMFLPFWKSMDKELFLMGIHSQSWLVAPAVGGYHGESFSYFPAQPGMCDPLLPSAVLARAALRARDVK